MTTAIIDRKTIIDTAGELEPLPLSVTRLATLVADRDADLADIVEVISYDPPLAGGLLKKANSAASAPRSPIVEISHAATRLGSAAVLAMAMSQATSKVMQQALPGYGLRAGELWIHSVAAATSAEVIRSKARRMVPPQAVTAALLHDIGKLVLSKHLSPALQEAIAAMAASEGIPTAEAEREVLGVDHAEVGNVVATAWNLPVSIKIGITQHHNGREVDDIVARAVAAADLLADGVVQRAAGVSPGSIAVPPPFKDTVAGLDLTDGYHDLTAAAFTRFEQVAEQYL